MKQPANVFRPPGSSRYCYKFKFAGQWYRGPTGKTDRREAIQFVRAEKERVKREALLHVERTGSGMTVLEAFSKHVGDLKERAGERIQSLKAAANLRDIERGLERVVELIGPDTPMSRISNDTMKAIIFMRREEPKRTALGKLVLRRNPRTGQSETVRLSGRTINKTTWQLVRPVYIKARDVWHVPVQPIDWKKLAVLEAGPRTREISIEEEDKTRALPEFGGGYGACFSFAIISGLRLENFINLTWSQVDLANREIKIIQKGGRPHTVNIDSEMLRILKDERGKDPVHVFTYVTQRTYFNKKARRQCTRGERRPVTASGFTSWFNRVRKKLRLVDIRIHDLRRTAGGRLLRATGNLKAVQQLLGHSDISTTAKFYSYIPPIDQICLQDRAHEDIRRRRYELSLLQAA